METILCIKIKLQNGEEIWLPKKEYEINPKLFEGSYVIGLEKGNLNQRK